MGLGIYGSPPGISIHTTLAGGDQMLVIAGRKYVFISIHTTLAGGDIAAPDAAPLRVISIHTTLAGGDL